MFPRPATPFAAIAAAVLLLAGCSLFDPSETPERERGEAFEVGLFDEGRVPRFELSVKEEDWAWLNTSENALKEECVPATLAIDGVEIGLVGVRYKGSSSLKNCFKEGRAPCPRPSMKIKFDEYRGKTRVDGMTKINLHGLGGNDDSMLRERLTYRLFREMGVAAPRASHAAVSVNGGPFGVYAMVEAVDAAFLENRWGSGAGEDNLWKEVWPRPYRRDLAAQLENGTVLAETGIKEFARALEKAVATGDGKPVERHVDVEKAMNYLAVDVVSDNIDGYRTFYCKANAAKPEDCSPHNFYWRQTWPENRLALIPWDLDATFLVNPWLTAPEWNDSTVACDAPLALEKTVWHAGCDSYFKALRTLYPDEWKAALKRLAKGPMSGYLVERWLKDWKKEIEPFVDEDTLFQRHPKYDKAWLERGYSGLTIAVGRQRQLLQDRLDGKLP